MSQDVAAIYKWLADEIYDILHKEGVDEARKYWLIDGAYQSAMDAIEVQERREELGLC